MPQQVLNYPLPRRPSELCSIAFLRYALFGFTTIFMLTGLALLGFGLWTLVEKSYLSPLLSPLFSISIYSMIVVGGLIIIAGIIGCQGAIQEKRCSLITFMVFLVFVFLAEAGTGAISYWVYVKMTELSFTEQLSETAVMNWGSSENEAITKAIDEIQMKYKCCGAKLYTDWRSNNLIKSLNTTTPDSCCINPISGCGKINHPSNLNREGCAKFIEDDISLNIVMIPALCLGFSIVQIFGVVFSCALTRRISQSRRFIRKKYHY